MSDKAPNVYISDIERTLIIERFNRTQRTIASIPERARVETVVQGLLNVIMDQNATLSIVVDVLGNTTRRKG